jgi:hypothetical protein
VVEQEIWRVKTDQELRELRKCLETVAAIGMDWKGQLRDFIEYTGGK